MTKYLSIFAVCLLACGGASEGVADQKVPCIDYWAVAAYPGWDMTDLTLHVVAVAHDDAKGIEEIATSYVRQEKDGPEVVAGCFVPGYVLFHVKRSEE